MKMGMVHFIKNADTTKMQKKELASLKLHKRCSGYYEPEKSGFSPGCTTSATPNPERWHGVQLQHPARAPVERAACFSNRLQATTATKDKY